MNRFFFRLLLALAAFGAMTGNASAAGTCSITSVTLAGQTYNGTAINVAGTVNWTCTRTASGTDGSPTTFVVTADPGGNSSGATRRAAATGLFIPYGLDIGGVAWGDGVSGQGNGTTVTASFAGSGTTVSGSFPFNFTVASGLLPLVGRTYLDSVTVGGTCTTKKNSGCTVTTNTPTDVSSTTGYNLAGTGLNITYWVNASAAAGQPGTCATASCTVSTPHTLLLEY